MSNFAQTVTLHLSPFGHITTRKMFGGYGVYKDGVIIGMIVHDELYLKASPQTEPYFESFGSHPFIYEGKDKPVKMSYWKVVLDVWNSSSELKKWVEMAHETSLASHAKKKRKN